MSGDRINAPHGPRTSFATAMFDRLRSRVRRGILLEGLAVAALAFIVYLIVSFAVDRTFRLEVGFRAALLAGFVFVVVRLVYRRTVRPMRIELDDDEMALAVERSDTKLHQSLISAVQFDRQLGGDQRIAESPELMRRVVDEVRTGIDRVDSHRALDARRNRRHLSIVAGCAALVLGWAIVSPSTIKLWALRNLGMSDQAWPRDTQLAFVGIDADRVLRLPEGDDQTLIVRADGVVPEEVSLRYRFAGGERGGEVMALTGERQFTYTLQSVLDDVVLWAEGGDGITEEIRIELVERPRIQELAVELVFPDYMARAPEAIADTEGDVRVPRGGKLNLAARSTKPLLEAFVGFGQERRETLTLGADGASFTGTFVPDESGLLTIDLRDRDDLGTARPSRLFLRLTEDTAPVLDFQATGVGSMITPFARIPGTLTVRDDYGLREIDAQFRTTVDVATANATSDDKPVEKKETPFEAAAVNGLDAFVDGNSEFEGPVLFDLLPLSPNPDQNSAENRFRPGQFLSLRFRARDNFGPGDPHLGESEAFTFRIVTREKLMEDLSRRQAEYRRELEQIRDDERAQRTELAEILSPAATDPNAARARLRVLALARTQRALGRRVQGVAERYLQILDEFRNNRILEPGKVAELRGQIPDPLSRLAKEDFPSSVRAVEEFAQTGQEDVRAVVVSSYESIVQQIEAVLEHMSELENFATLIEDLRQIIKVQNSAIADTQKRRDEDAAGIFGTDKSKKTDRTPGTNRDERRKE